MNRPRSREVAMELMYQMEIHKVYDMAFMNQMFSHYEEVLDNIYVVELIETWLSHRDDIEKNVTEHLKGWTLERISKLDLTILRLGITEMEYIDNIPKKVSINEAVNLAKKYVDEKSGKFINGVLSQFAKEENQ